jgi:hypothetical protein
MDEIRKPFFVLALIAWLLVVVVELGSNLLPVPEVTATQLKAQLLHDAPDQPPPVDGDLEGMVRARSAQPPRPGYAIASLIELDGLAFMGLFWMGAGLVISRRLVGRVQAIASLIVSLIAIIVGILLAIRLVVLIFVMLGLFLAPPFGTLAYLAIWGFFATAAATTTLGILLALKLAAVVLLVLAQQNFLKNTGLVVLVVLSLLLTLLVNFLVGFPPGILVSITDVFAALVVVIVAIIWALLVFIASIVATIKAIPPENTAR